MAARPRKTAYDTSHPPSAPNVESTPRPLEAIAGSAVNTVPALDAIIHERARLAIVTALASGAIRSHTELRDLLQLSDGNLSVHARRLEEAGYLECLKSFEGRLPRTEYRLSVAGKKALKGYLDHMEALIRATRAR